MKFKVVMAVVFAAILISACCPCERYQSKYGKPLQETTWTLTQMDGHSYAPAENYNIVFDSTGRVSGMGDCNRFFGGYEAATQSGAMKIDNLASTRMMCPNQQMESQFLAMLQSIDSYTLDGPQLMLFRNSELVAVFSAPATVNTKKSKKK